MIAPVRSSLAFARRHAFVIQLVIAVVASLAFLVFASEAIFTRTVSTALTDQDARGYVADATALEIAYLEGSNAEDSIDDVLDLVDSMEDRLGVDSATLLDFNGNVVTAPRDADMETERGLVTDLGVRPTYNDVEVLDTDHGIHRFSVPITLDAHRFHLRVDTDGHLHHARVASLSRDALLFSVASLLIAIVLFYLVGGRTLARRHSLVVKRATRDSLTELGNHGSFHDELERAVAVAARRQEPLALAIVDLNDFKFTNDRYGHVRGDEVLLEVARVLEAGRPGDRAFRIGGDEFALLLPGSDGAEARVRLERCIATTRAGATKAEFTIGVAVLLPGSDIDPADLREQADAALYEGKRTGRDLVVFNDIAELLAVVTPAKTRALHSLLDEPRMEIAFQPIWDLQDGRVLGLEALARPWAGYGFDGPADMFAVAEKVGRAHELDAVCRSATLARAHEIPDGVLLFLNLNPRSLTHDALGGDRLLRAVVGAGLDPSQVVLEITERSDARLSQVVADATRLRVLGFRIALDDVGVGNAGLEMLRELPVDFVKIDNSIIAAALEDVHAQAVLLAIIAYAGRAGAYVIAEGIETEQMLTFVQSADELRLVDGPPIKGGQGYLLGRPNLDISQVIAWPQVKRRQLPHHPVAPAASLRLFTADAASTDKVAS